MKTDLELLRKIKQLYDKSQLDTKFQTMQEEITSNDNDITSITESLSTIGDTVATNTENIETNTSNISTLSESVNANTFNISDLFKIDGISEYDTTTSYPFYMEMTSATTPEPFSITTTSGGFDSEGIGGRIFVYQAFGSNVTGMAISGTGVTIKIATGGINLHKIVFTNCYFATSGMGKKVISVSSDDITYKDITITNSDANTHINDTGITNVKYIKMTFSGTTFYLKQITLYQFNPIILKDKIMLVDSEDKLVNTDTETQREVLAFIKDSGIYYYNQKTNNKIQILNIPEIGTIVSTWGELQGKPFDTIGDTLSVSEDKSLGIEQSIIEQINTNTESIQTNTSNIQSLTTSVDNINSDIVTISEDVKTNTKDINELINTKIGTNIVKECTPAMTSNTTPEPFKITFQSVENAVASQSLYKTFTADSTVWFYPPSDNTLTFTVEFDREICIDNVKFAQVTRTSSIASWAEIYGSNDNTDFSTLIGRLEYNTAYPNVVTEQINNTETDKKFRYIRFKFYILDTAHELLLQRINIYERVQLKNKLMVLNTEDELESLPTDTNHRIIAIVKDSGIIYYNQENLEKIKVLDLSSISGITSWTKLQNKPFETINSDMFEVDTNNELKINKNSIITLNQDWIDSPIEGGNDVEIEVTPAMTSNTEPSPYSISVTSGNINAQYSGKTEPYLLFNGDDTKYIHTSETASFTLDYGKLINFSKIVMNVVAATSNYSSMTHRVYGSIDNSTFTTLYENIGTSSGDSAALQITITDQTKYRYYKFEIVSATYGVWKTIKLYKNLTEDTSETTQLILSQNIPEESIDVYNSKILYFVENEGVYTYDRNNGNRVKILSIPDITSIVTTWTEIQNKPFEAIGDTLSVSAGGTLNVNENIINGIESDISSIAKYSLYIDDPQW